MLHIKDIEAFAHINEALARDTGATDKADDHRPPAHPALLLAMVATGRLKPEESDDEPSGETSHHRHASLAGMMARMLGARR